MEFYNNRQTYNPISQLAFLLLFAGIGIVVGTIATFGIALATIDAPLKNLATEILKPENVDVSRVMQAVATFFYMALPAFVFAKIISDKPLNELGFTKSLKTQQLVLVVFIAFAALFVSGALGELNNMIPLSTSLEAKFKAMEDNYNQGVLSLSLMKTFNDYIISLILIALLPAIFEEMFFRGALQQIFIKLFSNPFIGILVTSLFFSAIHLSFYGFLPRLFLGMMLGYIFYYSKNLWFSVLGHFLNNAVALTQMYLLSKEGKLNDETMNDTFPLYYGAIAIAILAALFIRFRKESTENISAV